MGWRITISALVVLAVGLIPHSATAVVLQPLPPTFRTTAAPSLAKRAGTENDVVLIPLPPTLLSGLSKRDNDFSGLAPDRQARFLFGAPLDVDDAIFIAKVTVNGKETLPIVAMENFEHITTAVECNDSDGKMSMTFFSPEAVDAAKAAWQPLQNSENKNGFLLVANHQGCGPDRERVPYRASDVVFDNLVATFSVRLESWDKTQMDFEMDFLKEPVEKKVAQRVRMLHRRGWFTDPFKKAWEKTKEGVEKLKDKAEEVIDKVEEKGKEIIDKVEEKGKEAVEKTKDIAQDVGEKIEDTADKAIDKTKEVGEKIEDKAKEVGEKIDDKAHEIIDKTKELAHDVGQKIKQALSDMDWDKEKTVTWKFDSGAQGTRKNVYTDKLNEIPQLVIDCIDCYLTGGVTFTGRLRIENGVTIKELSVEMDPADIKARMELNVRISKTLKDFTISQSVFELPLAGIVIPGIFTLGTKLDYEVGATLSAPATLNFTVGAEATVPASAIAKLDLVNHDASTADGFGDMAVSAVKPRVDAASGGFSAAVYAQPVFSLGFTVMNSIGLEASLKLRLPSVNANAAAVRNVDGACPADVDPERRHQAVTVRAAVATELWLYVGEDKTIGEKSFFNKKLWGEKWPFVDKCFPVDGIVEEKVKARRWVRRGRAERRGRRGLALVSGM